MSQAVVEQVIGKMVIDPEFRKSLAVNMDQTLAAYDLTPGEREGFTRVDLEDFHQTVTGLDERVSKGSQIN